MRRVLRYFAIGFCALLVVYLYAILALAILAALTVPIWIWFVV